MIIIRRVIFLAILSKVLTTTAHEDQRFRDLFSQLVAKSNLTDEKIEELIREKKSKVGGGYLTDQGALFLVASQLGIDIKFSNRPQSISQITAEAASLNFTSRVLSIGLRIFDHKENSGKGLLLRLTVYDNTGAISLNLWDGAAASFLAESDIKPGDAIRITNAYAKQGLDGTIILYLTDKGKIEKITEGQLNEPVKHLQEVLLMLSSLPETGKMLSVRGVVQGEVKKNSFVRSDGSTSQYCSFILSDQRGAKVRTIIWNNFDPILSSLKNDDIVTLLNIKTKVSTFQDRNELEIHCDESTRVLEKWDETRNWMTEIIRDFRSSKEIRPQSDRMSSNPGQVPVPFVARIVSISRMKKEEKSYLLLVDSQDRKIQVTLLGKTGSPAEGLEVDDVVVCKPKTFEPSTLKVTIESNSIVKSNSKRLDIPKSDSLLATVEDLESGQVVSLELMCMSDSQSREIQTKEGLIRRTEISVGDHTGEIKVYAWRELSKSLDNFSVGDRIMIRAVEVQSHEGKKFLSLKNYTSVTKLT